MLEDVLDPAARRSQCLFRPLALADVAVDAEITGDLPPVVPQRHVDRLDLDGRAVPAIGDRFQPRETDLGDP
jgi:hypothetical protein